MWHKIKVWLKSFKLKNTIKRTRYRLYLWRIIKGQERVSLRYSRSSVGVSRPDECYLTNHDSIEAISLMFKSSPKGRFQMDEGSGRFSLSEEDSKLPIKNPFEVEEKEELLTLGRVLTREERSYKKLLKKIDAIEEKYYREF